MWTLPRIRQLSKAPAPLLKMSVEVVKLFHKREREGSRLTQSCTPAPAHTAPRLITGVCGHLLCGFSSESERLRLPVSHVAVILFNTGYMANTAPSTA